MKVFRNVIVALLLVSILVATAACGSTPKKQQEPATSDQTKGGDDTKPNDNDGDNKDNEDSAEKDPETGLTPMKDRTPISFDMFLRDPGQAPAKDNPVINKITELTGVTINFEFLVGDLNEKVGVMIAGGDYPDIIFGEAAKFFDAGALIPVEDYINKYPNLKEHYAPFMDAMIAGFDGQHAYTVENYNAIHNPAPMFENGGAGFFIQKAVLKESGYKIPKTIDEYFDIIEAYMEKYPKIDGVDTIGFEILCDGWRDFCLRNPAMHLLGAGNEGDIYVDSETFEASLYQITDTAKAYYKKLNEEYHKGVIQAETLTQNYDQYIARLSTGAVLGMFDQAWNFGNATNALKADKKFERTYVSVPIANPGVQDGYLDAPSETISGTGGISVTKNCKEPDRLFAFYDWLLNREVQDYLQWGIEGKDWIKAEGNQKKLTDERRELVRDVAKRRDLTGDTLWQYTPKKQGLYDDGTPCGPGDSEAEYMAALSEFDQQFLTDLDMKYPAQLLSPPVKRPAYYPVWAFVIEDGSPAKTASTKMIDTCRKYYPRLVLCDPDEYDALWDEFVKEVEAGNPQPYIDEVNRQVKVKMEAAGD